MSDLNLLDRPVQPEPHTGELLARVVDQFFRRWALYLLPVVLLGGLGVVNALNAAPDYASVGRLSATANPLLDETPSRAQVNQFEPAATGVARLINESLGTDTFLDEVAGRAGLGDLVANGVINRDVIRGQISAEPSGNNVLAVRALWGDPETAFRLVDATIDTYREVVQDTVAQDSKDAISLLEVQRGLLEERQNTAETALTDFIDDNPLVSLDRDDRPIEVELTIARLNSELETANQAVSLLDDQIGTAEQTAIQAQSDAGRQLAVVDEPILPTEPEPLLMTQILSLVMFLTLGLLVAGAALGVVTYLDGSVRLLSQVRGSGARGSVLAVPALKSIRRSDRSSAGKRTSQRRSSKDKVA